MECQAQSTLLITFNSSSYFYHNTPYPNLCWNLELAIEKAEGKQEANPHPVVHVALRFSLIQGPQANPKVTVWGEQAQSILGLGMRSPLLFLKSVFRKKVNMNPNHYFKEVHSILAHSERIPKASLNEQVSQITEPERQLVSQTNTFKKLGVINRMCGPCYDQGGQLSRGTKSTD